MHDIKWRADFISAAASPTAAAAMGGQDMRDGMAFGMNPQHAIVSGLGGTSKDSLGFPGTATPSPPAATCRLAGCMR